MATGFPRASILAIGLISLDLFGQDAGTMAHVMMDPVPSGPSGRTLDPLPLRAVTWEFGDGSVSRVLPPRPWNGPGTLRTVARHTIPFQEYSGGSPCAAVLMMIPGDPEEDPRPGIIGTIDGAVLVTTGLGDLDLAVQPMEALTGRRGAPVLMERTSGQWEIRGPLEDASFVSIRNITTGERWWSLVVR